MTFRSISARLLPNARTAFTSDLFKKIPRRRDFRRYLFLPLTPFPFSFPLCCIDFFFLFFFIFAFINTFRAIPRTTGNPLTGVSPWNTNGTEITKGYTVFRCTRESSRKRKSRWLIRGETKANRSSFRRIEWAKVNNSWFFLCDSLGRQAWHFVVRLPWISATSLKTMERKPRRHQTEINAIRISWRRDDDRTRNR